MRYGKTLISIDERKPVDEGRLRILSDWRARIALFVEADRQFIISRCGDFDGGRKTSVVTNTSMHPPGFVGPPGIEELLLVDFAVAEKIRRQAEEFLHAEPMFQCLSL